MIEIAFVILHYNCYEETINCIQSIEANCKGKNYYIVVVDNCSPNKSGRLLADRYQNNSLIHVELNAVNDGFARGNNKGITYIRQHMCAKFICCLNNDTLIVQENFVDVIYQEYDYSHAALIGPQIIQKNNKVQQYSGKLLSVEEYRKELLYFSNYFIPNIRNKIKIFVNKLLTFVKIMNCVHRDKAEMSSPFKRKENVMLHGCCLIFTPEFFKKLEGFDERTDFYREEELLYINVISNNLLSVYNPQIQIKHLEDVSTNSFFRSAKEKKHFFVQNQIKSLSILIEELEKKGNINK